MDPTYDDDRKIRLDHKRSFRQLRADSHTYHTHYHTHTPVTTSSRNQYLWLTRLRGFAVLIISVVVLPYLGIT